MYRSYIRCLVFFVNENNEVLHEQPLQIKWRGGFFGTMNVELQNLYQKTGSVYAKAASASGNKTKGDQLPATMKPFVVAAPTLTPFSNEGKAPFTCPAKIATPVINPANAGKELIEDRTYNGVKRSVTLVGVPMSKILISKASPSYPSYQGRY